MSTTNRWVWLGYFRKISHNNVSFSLKISPYLRKKIDIVLFGFVQCDQMRCPLRHENPQQDMVDVYHCALTWRSRRVLKLEIRKEFKSTIVKERPTWFEKLWLVCVSAGGPIKQGCKTVWDISGKVRVNLKNIKLKWKYRLFLWNDKEMTTQDDTHSFLAA